MSFFDLLRKGFGYVLLSMGVSRPKAKPMPHPKPKPPYNKGGSKNKPADGG